MKLYTPSDSKHNILNKNIIKIRSHYSSNKTYDNILLIINYNTIGFENLNDYLLTIYKNVFNNIIFISPGNFSDNNTISCNDSKDGFYSYICLKKIYNKYPKFKGYLFINDDDIPWFYTFSKIKENWNNVYNCSPNIDDIINNNLVWKSNLIKFMGYYEIPTTIADFYYLKKTFDQITVHPIKFSQIENRIKVELYIFFTNAKEY